MKTVDHSAIRGRISDFSDKVKSLPVFSFSPAQILEKTAEKLRISVEELKDYMLLILYSNVAVAMFFSIRRRACGLVEIVTAAALSLSVIGMAGAIFIKPLRKFMQIFRFLAALGTIFFVLRLIFRRKA